MAMSLPAAAAGQPHNIVLFIPDGLRALMVSEETAPTMAAIRAKGVNFKNPHSLFPTFTTPNASAMATGHYLGDTGDFTRRLLRPLCLFCFRTITDESSMRACLYFKQPGLSSVRLNP